MKFSLMDLDKCHPVILAAKMMHDLYFENDGMYEPCLVVKEKFPELTPEQVMCLWVGINMSNCSDEQREKVALMEV
ncbi:hypothetical protein [Vibrio harveyi]|uniref:hypothetical protein n=1 Tax=Vibrio harveyi TaxID=669 RepID=UPI002380C076|nr:hypothetical protein [Vibrio harveyi]